MSLTDSEVRGYKAGKSRQVATCGDALFLVVEPFGKGGGKSFMGVMRFPPCSPKNGGKRVEYRIGPYGKGVGKWSLKEARNEWERVSSRLTQSIQKGACLRTVPVPEGCAGLH